MKSIYTLFILCILFAHTAMSQSLTIYDVDTTDFPIIRAKLYAFDEKGNFLTDLSYSDFIIKENGVERTTLNLRCPEPSPYTKISSVLVMDASGSMCDEGLYFAKGAAIAWVEILDLKKSECAITSFNDENYINQDFTNDKYKLLAGIKNLSCRGGTNYNSALIEPPAGGIQIAMKGKHKRIIVFLTDGEPDFEPRTNEIISLAKANNITIYCVTIRFFAPQCMKEFSKQTEGICFENITTQEEAEICYRKIFSIVEAGKPCVLEWKSDYTCPIDLINVEAELLPIKKSSKTNYVPSKKSIVNLEFNPLYLRLTNTIKDTCTTIKVTAKNTNINISEVIISNPNYTITPSSNITLYNGIPKEFKVCYKPTDSSYSICKIDFLNRFCIMSYYVCGGFPNFNTNNTLKIIKPNGGETFVVGDDTTITWQGVIPDEPVQIEYSTNNGKDWITIADSAKQLKYDWKIPNSPSNNCLAKVSTYKGNDNYYPEVLICNQIWMGKNLDVDTYRNGDIIPQVTDSTVWDTLKTGAWCYYQNDSANGKIYGKLYNWYAVNDPRGLAPKGWHIPSDDEWKQLEMCLGMSQQQADSILWRGNNEGAELKETGIVHWKYPNNGATNESGFTALPGGYRQYLGKFSSLTYYGSWWTSSKFSINIAWSRELYSFCSTVFRYNKLMSMGKSVRCIKDK